MVNNQHRRETRGAARGLGFGPRLAIFYGVVFLLIGGFLPYFAVWLDGRGLGPEEIGIVLATPLFVRVLVTPVVSFAADRTGDRRRVLILLAWGTLAASLVFTQAHDFWTILAVSVFWAVFWTSIMPLVEAVAMAGVRQWNLDYGRMRLWGSLSFIAASTGGGLAIQRFGTEAALGMFIVAAAAVVAGAHILPRPAGQSRLEATTAMPRIRARDALALARTPLFLLFLLATSAAQSAHAVYYVFGTIHWRGLGISTGIIGLLWAIGVIAEVVLFTRSGRIVRKYGPLRLICFAGLAAALRWSLTALDPPLWALFPVQVLHGATFGAAHLGAVHFISAAVPEECAGTAQGLYASVTAGIAMGAAMVASGPLYRALGGDAYFAMAVLGILAFLAAWRLLRLWDGDKIITGVGYAGSAGY